MFPEENGTGTPSLRACEDLLRPTCWRSVGPGMCKAEGRAPELVRCSENFTGRQVQLGRKCTQMASRSLCEVLDQSLTQHGEGGGSGEHFQSRGFPRLPKACSPPRRCESLSRQPDGE